MAAMNFKKQTNKQKPPKQNKKQPTNPRDLILW